MPRLPAPAHGTVRRPAQEAVQQPRRRRPRPRRGGCSTARLQLPLLRPCAAALALRLPFCCLSSCCQPHAAPSHACNTSNPSSRYHVITTSSHAQVIADETLAGFKKHGDDGSTDAPADDAYAGLPSYMRPTTASRSVGGPGGPSGSGGGHARCVRARLQCEVVDGASLLATSCSLAWHVYECTAAAVPPLCAAAGRRPRNLMPARRAGQAAGAATAAAALAPAPAAPARTFSAWIQQQQQEGRQRRSTPATSRRRCRRTH